MKFQSQNNAENLKKKHLVFSEKQLANIRIKLGQLVEIEYHYYDKKQAENK